MHVKPEGYAFTLRPQDHLCIGPDCAETDHYCVDQCPQKALTMRRNPSAECMGDPRWSSDLILSTWHQAATGHAPPSHLEHRRGAVAHVANGGGRGLAQLWALVGQGSQINLQGRHLGHCRQRLGYLEPGFLRVGQGDERGDGGTVF